MTGICTEEAELLFHHGSLRQAGLIRLSLDFPQDTSSGHAFVGKDCCCAWAGNLSLGVFHWAGVILSANHALKLLTAEILMRSSLPTTKVLLSLCLVVYSIPSLRFQPAPGYRFVKVVQVVISPWGEMEISQPKFNGFGLQFIDKLVEVSCKLNEHGLLKITSAKVIICYSTHSAEILLVLAFCTS